MNLAICDLYLLEKHSFLYLDLKKLLQTNSYSITNHMVCI